MLDQTGDTDKVTAMVIEMILPKLGDYPEMEDASPLYGMNQKFLQQFCFRKARIISISSPS